MARIKIPFVNSGFLKTLIPFIWVAAAAKFWSQYKIKFLTHWSWGEKKFAELIFFHIFSFNSIKRYVITFLLRQIFC